MRWICLRGLLDNEARSRGMGRFIDLEKLMCTACAMVGPVENASSFLHRLVRFDDRSDQICRWIQLHKLQTM